MKKIVKLLCIVLSLLTIACCSVACGEKEEYSYWQTQAKQAGESRMVYTAELSFGTSNINLVECWINISNFKAQSTNITVRLSTSTTATPKTIQKSVTSQQVKDSEDGWVKLDFGSEVSCKIAVIEIVDEMRVNEIVFVKADGKLATITFTKGGVKAGSSANLYTKAELEALVEGNLAYSEHYAFNIIDEQDKFPLSKIQISK